MCGKLIQEGHVSILAALMILRGATDHNEITDEIEQMKQEQRAEQSEEKVCRTGREGKTVK